MKKRFIFALGCAFLASGCVANTNQMAAFSTETSQAQQRQLDTRWFETSDEAKVLQAVIGVLQDTGFKVTETNLEQGLVSGRKSQARNGLYTGRDVRITVTTFRVGENSIRVRVTLQDISAGMDPRYYRGVQIRDATIYQDFFNKLSQSLFLDANSV